MGFYHPRLVLDALQPVVKVLAAQPATRAALVSALATMRSLHFDPVDAFLDANNADDALRRDVAAAVDMDRVQQFMRPAKFACPPIKSCGSGRRRRRSAPRSRPRHSNLKRPPP